MAHFSEGLSVGHATLVDGGDGGSEFVGHFSLLALANHVGWGRSGWRVSLGDRYSHLTQFESFSTKLAEDDLQVSRFLQVHEVLGVLTPVLVLRSVIKHASPTVSVGVGPCTFKFFLKSWGEMDKLALLRGEDSEEERPFGVFTFVFGVRNDNVMDILLVVGRL